MTKQMIWKQGYLEMASKEELRRTIEVSGLEPQVVKDEDVEVECWLECDANDITKLYLVLAKWEEGICVYNTLSIELFDSFYGGMSEVKIDFGNLVGNGIYEQLLRHINDKMEITLDCYEDYFIFRLEFNNWVSELELPRELLQQFIN